MKSSQLDSRPLLPLDEREQGTLGSSGEQPLPADSHRDELLDLLLARDLGFTVEWQVETPRPRG